MRRRRSEKKLRAGPKTVVNIPLDDIACPPARSDSGGSRIRRRRLTGGYAALRRRSPRRLRSQPAAAVEEGPRVSAPTRAGSQAGGPSKSDRR